jgi:hypothetical protein
VLCLRGLGKGGLERDLLSDSTSVQDPTLLHECEERQPIDYVINKPNHKKYNWSTCLVQERRHHSIGQQAFLSLDFLGCLLYDVMMREEAAKDVFKDGATIKLFGSAKKDVLGLTEVGHNDYRATKGL